MPNIALLPKTVYNNSNGEPKNQETAPTRYEAWDAEQMSGKTNEIITDVNNLSENKADQTDLDSLETRVTTNEGDIQTLQNNQVNPNNFVNKVTSTTQNMTGRLTVQTPLDSNTSDAANVEYVLGKVNNITTPIATDSVLGGIYFKDDSASSTLTISTSPIV